jgi:hypothetical protein
MSEEAAVAKYAYGNAAEVVLTRTLPLDAIIIIL